MKRAVLILIVIAVGVAWIFLRPRLLEIQDLAQRASCRPMSFFHTAVRYAADHNGEFPPLSKEYGRLSPELETVYPRYTDENLSEYICDADVDAPDAHLADTPEGPSLFIDDNSYFYLGYRFENESQGLVFISAYMQAAVTGEDLEDALAYPGEGVDGVINLKRLYLDLGFLPKKGERGYGFHLDDSREPDAHLIPVVVERPHHHLHPGGHVIYLDGHREYVLYPSKFPMTEAFIKGLEAIDALGSRKATSSP